ncbi:Hypothetical predicted protein, partial [Pelobates cultripes]
LEDRSTRNNLRFRGIPEMVQHSDLANYLMFRELILATHPEQLVTDRVHRRRRPSNGHVGRNSVHPFLPCERAHYQGLQKRCPSLAIQLYPRLCRLVSHYVAVLEIAVTNQCHA